MNKQKILNFIKKPLGASLITGILCFSIGAILMSDNNKVKELNEENLKLATKLETETSSKDNTIKELQSKVNEAKPWFDQQENERKQQEEARQAEEKEKAQKAAEENAKLEAEEKAKLAAKGVDTSALKSTLETEFKKQFNGEIKNTTLTSLNVNENLGTSSNKDVIVLANLKWTTRNSEKLTREILDMYGGHLAAKIAPSLANGSELVLFWKAEYTGLDIKQTYTIKDGKAFK